jgi:hypothetical protein
MTQLQLFYVVIVTKETINRMENLEPSKEQLERKARSIAILKKEEIPYIDHLPVIERECEINARSKEEVALRALCLLVVGLKGEELEQKIIDKIVKDKDLKESFTDKEKAFLWGSQNTKQDYVNATWCYEAAWVLLWALGFVDDLGRPEDMCDVPMAVTIMKDLEQAQFISSAKLRPVSKMLDQADLIYRYHWAVVNARVNGIEPPTNLDASVVLERHHALNWLTSYMDQDWDDVSTDT